jgi:hypothetical protein
MNAAPTMTTATTYIENSVFPNQTNSTLGFPLVANLGSATQGNRRIFTFTPPVVLPNNPINFSITDITQTSMRLNWTDNSTNEKEFLITSATDSLFTQDINTYTFVDYSGTSSPLLNSVISVLTPGTKYYFKIQAVTEGYEPNSGIVKSETTIDHNIYTWNGTTSAWSNPNNWTPARTTTNETDVLVFDGNNTTASKTVSYDATINQNVAKISVINAADITLNGASAGKILNVGGANSNDFVIDATSKLALGANQINLNITGNYGNTALIAGTLIINSGTFITDINGCMT